MTNRKGRDQSAIEKSGRIIRQKKDRLRQRIVQDAALERDFEFLLEKTGWREEMLLSFLFWDCNMSAASPQAVLARDKHEHWPIDEVGLRHVVRDLLQVAKQVDRVNQTDFSPTRTALFYNERGELLPQREADRLRGVANELPEILQFYASDLRRKISLSAAHWRRHKPRVAFLVDMTRRNSLYEHIRARTGRYHQTRLCRLVNAARLDQGLPAIEQRAFTIWLNRLKKKHATKQMPTSSPTP